MLRVDLEERKFLAFEQDKTADGTMTTTCNGHVVLVVNPDKTYEINGDWPDEIFIFLMRKLGEMTNSCHLLEAGLKDALHRPESNRKTRRKVKKVEIKNRKKEKLSDK